MDKFLEDLIRQKTLASEPKPYSPMIRSAKKFRVSMFFVLWLIATGVFWIWADFDLEKTVSAIFMVQFGYAMWRLVMEGPD